MIHLGWLETEVSSQQRSSSAATTHRSQMNKLFGSVAQGWSNNLTDPIGSDLKNLDLDRMRMKTPSRLDWIVIRSGQIYLDRMRMKTPSRLDWIVIRSSQIYPIEKFKETKLVSCICKSFMIQFSI